MPINENLSWAQVGAISTGASATVKDAFKGGHAEKVLLPAGFKLYKFNEYNSLAPPNAATVSPWWTAYDPYKHDGGWEQRKKLAAVLGVSTREFGRVTSAIKENWNSLSYLLIIVLGHATYAYFGGFAQMARIDPGQSTKRKEGEARGSTKNLPGGGTQFYIPNLRPQDVSSWNAEPLV